jgi:hypothetical protein
MMVGSFARGEVSPLPWTAFVCRLHDYGIADGLSQAVIVTTVDLWLLWIPAQIFITNHPEVDPRTRRLARLLNLAVGLLLMTKHNPVYWLLDFPPAPPDY